MTATEQIIWAHRVDTEQREVKPGDTLRVYADLLPASDGTAPFAIHTFNQITTGHDAHPRQAASPTIISSSRGARTMSVRPASDVRSPRSTVSCRRIMRRLATGSSTSIFPSRARRTRSVHSRRGLTAAPMARTARVGIGIGSTTLGFGWATGYIYVTLPKARRVVPQVHCSRGSLEKTSSWRCFNAGA